MTLRDCFSVHPSFTLEKMNADIDYTNKDFIYFRMWPSHSIFEKLPETFHVTDTSYIREIKFSSTGFRPGQD